MIDVLAGTVIILAVLVAAESVVPFARFRRPGRVVLAGVAVLELAVLAQLVAAVVLTATGSRPLEAATFFGYHIAAVLTLPAGLIWSEAERSRWAPLVLTVACLVVAVLTVRLQQIWAVGPGV